MRNLFLLPFSIILLISCDVDNSKTTIKIDKATINLDSVSYLKKCIDFIRQVKEKELSDSLFILSDRPSTLEDFDCLKEISNDTTTYSNDEIAFIKKSKSRSISKWPKELFPNIKLISSDTIHAIFKTSSAKGWQYFYKNIGSSVNTFSVPIFLRNNTYCLFYSDYYCGSLCAGGRTTLYKKEHGKWTEVKSYCNWIS